MRPVFAPFLLLLALTACDRPRGDEPSDSVSDPVAEAPKAETGAPKPFRLARADAETLFVWQSPEGEFKTTTTPTEVPAAAATSVRVIHPAHPSDSNFVWVTNVSRDGDFEVTSMPRGEWEGRGRGAREQSLAKADPPQEKPAAKDDYARVQAIVYGASWCHACHLAENYLKGLGVPTVKKDIEEDPTAQREMSDKLRRAGQGGSSIPVLDIGGTILVGFSEAAVNSALARAARKK